MQFQCPHCAARFDTQRSGVQFCPNCGRQVEIGASPKATVPGSVSESSPPPAGETPPPPDVQPPGGAPPGGRPPPGEPSIRRPTPWERRREIGFLQALLETWKQTLMGPDRFFSSVRPDGPWEDAFLYAWLLAVITLVGTAILRIPFQAMIAEQVRRSLDRLSSMGNLPPEAQQYVAIAMGARPGLQIWWTVMQIILWPILIFIVAAIVHVFCIVFGCAANGYWATFRALCYGHAPVVFFIFAQVPCIGWAISLVALVFTFVVYVWAVMRLQDTSGGKAAAAVLAMPLLFCCCGCGLSVVAGTALKSMLGGGN